MRSLGTCLTLLLVLGSCGCGKPVETVSTSEEHHDEERHEAGAPGEPAAEHVELSPEAIAASGIVVQGAGPAPIRVTLQLPGEVAPNADRLAHIVPRFPGIARTIHKSLGDPVQQDQVLAVIESNESLSPYEVKSLISGTVIERHITHGEFVRDDGDIFVIADLSTVWVNLTVYPRDLERVRAHQRVVIRSATGGRAADGVIDYIGPVLGEPTRAATARVTLANPKRTWRPGMFVTADVVLSEHTVAVAVEAGAIQHLEGKDVVFVEEDGRFEARPVEVGPGDGRLVEIRSGLKTGERYVASGSFILKSELLKSEAGHEH